MKRFLFVIAVLMASCSVHPTPEDEGRRVAMEVNACAERFVASVWQLELACFDRYDDISLLWPDRMMNTVTSYRGRMKEYCKKYSRELGEANALKGELLDKYSRKAEERDAFAIAYSDAIDAEIFETANRLVSTSSLSIPFVVYSVLYGLDAEKPEPKPILSELMGRTADREKTQRSIQMCDEALARLEKDEVFYGDVDTAHLISQRKRLFQLLLGESK